jgi:hypothetical protein
MSAKNIVGTPKSVTINGYTYNVAADAELKHGKPKYKNEPEPTTGATFRKMTLQDEGVEGVKLKVNASELEQIKAVAESTDSVTLAYATIDGSVYHGSGFIDYESRSTSDGVVEVKLYPESGWVPFIA